MSTRCGFLCSRLQFSSNQPLLRSSFLTTSPHAMSTLGITELEREIFAVVEGNLSSPQRHADPRLLCRLDGSPHRQRRDLAPQRDDGRMIRGSVPYLNGPSRRTAREGGGQRHKSGRKLRLLHEFWPGGICALPGGQQRTQLPRGRSRSSAVGSSSTVLRQVRMARRISPPIRRTESLISHRREGRVRLLAGNQFMLAVGGSTAAAIDQERSLLNVATSGALEPAKVAAISL
ncbi:uncharacterized protein BO95DRAFT_492179 [Aspergillus brunneoviolaceus CBS 621.78]|uniref:Uncharacterized protein n=1 Tax=Aspergillus brunneoviolaceus CBS 621.78 TaxID=1450534 RepID=A0ACD1GPP6_9EURO|nr:hypothetical protein BO95DRAFT_492179 [Aspergillus brunneoviolaceus CBS 621.78]RAH51093.1 hypothetical protein BO95DRAFT_492179 [Aspergillus brunneoviolaceus CBS 621.78]